jgi:hypothetical protein
MDGKGNERPQPGNSRGNRTPFSDSNRTQPQSSGEVKDYEDRRNAAACFRNPNKAEDWHADFTGLAVVEGLRDGDKVWVNVYIRTDKKGRKFLSVV